MYSIKEIYYTIQGEGVHTGQAAVFCRFAGCNLWSGLEKDRATAICKFCDTDFWGTDGKNGGKYSAEELAQLCKSLWPSTSSSNAKPFIVCTGGEPLLQIDDELIKAFKKEDFFIAIETNGTIIPPQGIDWICVSPKARAEVKLTTGDELKLVYPQTENQPSEYEHLDFQYFSLQPLDNQQQKVNIQSCIDYVMAHPQWNLCLQTHKFIGLD
jgi:7-carboxy-7-deazaguanine synthase (Cx14CxxC type)